MSHVNITDRINACIKLGEILRDPNSETFHSFRIEIAELLDLMANSKQYNAWFTPENMQYAIQSIGESLEAHMVEKWMSHYPSPTFENVKPKTIGVVSAGNIPIVGFHDYLSVMLTGNHFLGKLSSDDNKLLPLIHRILGKIEPEYLPMATFTQERLTNFDAIIATGSNNTARYFEYYFEKYPHIIRKNRNGVAVFTGEETQEDFAGFGEDIFRYFGLGCRNVSKIYVPEDYKFDRFFEAIESYGDVILHHKYKNNYDYVKSILLINGVAHFDNGFLLVKEDSPLPTPVSAINYEKYSDIEQLKKQLSAQADQIQCIASIDSNIKGAIPPGKSQKPELWNYADNVDTIEFLRKLK